MIQLTLTLKMTTAQVVETSVTVNNNSPIQDYVYPDDLLIIFLNRDYWGSRLLRTAKVRFKSRISQNRYKYKKRGFASSRG